MNADERRYGFRAKGCGQPSWVVAESSAVRRGEEDGITAALQSVGS